MEAIEQGLELIEETASEDKLHRLPLLQLAPVLVQFQ